jgi:hypothetical protein
VEFGERQKAIERVAARAAQVIVIARFAVFDREAIHVGEIIVNTASNA